MPKQLPWFKMWHAEWLSDAKLRLCSHAARGVWMDMLCLMSQCDERGVLAIAGKPLTDDQIAAAVGGDRDSVLSCLRELVDHGVAVRRKRGGPITSARMVRDEQERQNKSKAGQASARARGYPPCLNRNATGPPSKPTTEIEQVLEHPSSVFPLTLSPQGGTGGDLGGDVVDLGGGDSVGVDWVGVIVAAYPRQGRPYPARDAVVEALARIVSGEDRKPPQAVDWPLDGDWGGDGPEMWLLARTKRYRVAVHGSEERLIPVAATWFSEGGYLQDPDQWVVVSSKPRPASAVPADQLRQQEAL